MGAGNLFGFFPVHSVNVPCKVAVVFILNVAYCASECCLMFVVFVVMLDKFFS